MSRQPVSGGMNIGRDNSATNFIANRDLKVLWAGSAGLRKDLVHKGTEQHYIYDFTVSVEVPAIECIMVKRSSQTILRNFLVTYIPAFT